MFFFIFRKLFLITNIVFPCLFHVLFFLFFSQRTQDSSLPSLWECYMVNSYQGNHSSQHIVPLIGNNHPSPMFELCNEFLSLINPVQPTFFLSLSHCNLLNEGDFLKDALNNSFSRTFFSLATTKLIFSRWYHNFPPYHLWNEI